ncbi:MAG: DUF1893 domain-containing protein [Bacillota bacterium]|nr:DUF1893 domain-containing protein [Bacillota bacterium]
MENKAKKLLLSPNTFAVVKDEESYTSRLRGILPLMELLDKNKKLLKGADAADKVIGKAAAMLFYLGGIKRLYTEIISENALSFLKNTEIELEFSKVVPYIINRSGDGMCPMEKLVIEAQSPTQAYELLKEKLRAKREHEK